MISSQFVSLPSGFSSIPLNNVDLVNVAATLASGVELVHQLHICEDRRYSQARMAGIIMHVFVHVNILYLHIEKSR